MAAGLPKCRGIGLMAHGFAVGFLLFRNSFAEGTHLLHKWNRYLAALLVLVMLSGSMPGVARALTARPAVPDMLSLADLLAGLPQTTDLAFPNPLAAVNASLLPPDMAGWPTWWTVWVSA